MEERRWTFEAASAEPFAMNMALAAAMLVLLESTPDEAVAEGSREKEPPRERLTGASDSVRNCAV